MDKGTLSLNLEIKLTPCLFVGVSEGESFAVIEAAEEMSEVAEQMSAMARGIA
jgi:hypothetical protein